MKRYNITQLTIVMMLVFTFCITSCTSNSPEIPEAEYSAKIIGSWRGTVGHLKERMTINPDGSFICQIYPSGFIANTLSQGVKGTVNGKWKVVGSVITLNVTGEKNEKLENNVAVSTIISLNENELTLKSEKGETSLFERVKTF